MEELMGAVKLFAFGFVPEGWLPCDGRLLPVSSGNGDETDTALFGLLGTVYGGDGIANFALPNLPPVASANGAQLHYCICLEGLYPSRPQA
jgi:microcystin-dependent protein